MILQKHNAQLTGKKWLAKISERSEQKANCFLSLFNFLLGLNYATNILPTEYPALINKYKIKPKPVSIKAPAKKRTQ